MRIQFYTWTDKWRCCWGPIVFSVWLWYRAARLPSIAARSIVILWQRCHGPNQLAECWLRWVSCLIQPWYRAHVACTNQTSQEKHSGTEGRMLNFWTWTSFPVVQSPQVHSQVLYKTSKDTPEGHRSPQERCTPNVSMGHSRSFPCLVKVGPH